MRANCQAVVGGERLLPPRGRLGNATPGETHLDWPLFVDAASHEIADVTGPRLTRESIGW